MIKNNYVYRLKLRNKYRIDIFISKLLSVSIDKNMIRGSSNE